MRARNLCQPGFLCLIAALVACADKPPEFRTELGDAGSPRAAAAASSRPDLVEVRTLVPGIICDLRYGTKNNVAGRALYPPDMPCLLHRATAEKLSRAQEILRAQGLGLKIWDAWRPPEVHAELFRHGRAAGKGLLFVDPNEAWSFHCSGTAVDVTLADAHGRELPMPTPFDDASPEAHTVTPPRHESVRRNLHALKDAMLKSGFSTIDLEWWHFDDIDFKTPATCLPAVFAKEIGIKLPAPE